MRPKCGGKSGNGLIFKKINQNQNIKTKQKNPGSPLEVTC